MITVQQIAAAFTGARILANTEAELGDAVARLLAKAGLAFEQEVEFTPRDRIDFLVGRVAIELKIKGSAPGVIRQISRYAESARVDALVLITTRRQHLAELPPTLNGKAVVGICVGGF